ncbi:hypothetical protein XI05_07515 [Bradyrhizobium sp. CCBAU 11357]|nr:hypothetical protein [Bradyrhizobium sp. CCBAU 11357]
MILCVPSSSICNEERREFLAGTAALLVQPGAFDAQGKPRRIGFLGVWADDPTRDPIHAAWLSGLRTKGWIEGKNLLVEYRYAPIVCLL